MQILGYTSTKKL